MYYLIKHLNKDLFHPIVLCPGDGELAEKMRSAGAEVLFLNLGRIRHMNLLVIVKLVSIIKEYSVNIVHSDSTTETFYASIAAKLTATPLVWHIRVSEGAGMLDRLLSALASKLVLVAKALSSRFKWLEGGSKLAVAHNAIDLREFDSFPASPSIREELGIGSSEVLLACTGRIEERKGQAHLIEAMKNIDNAKLVLFGRGEEKYLEHIKSLCEKYKVSDRIFFGGHRKDVPSILKEIDIFVFPVIYGEGFSRAILEAMAASIPVIASDDAGNPEAVIDGVTGHIVPAGDSIALSAKIKELVADKEKRGQMGRAGRKRVEDLFTIEVNVKKIEGIYLELLPVNL
ncbi:MAG: glycosyltransferase [Deltaproteobacteria bacterium]|nr:glycosyltransferase [Deltaproteobacteria bacterium]